MDSNESYLGTLLLAYSYIGENIDGYGKVNAITIYEEDHCGDRISFCFRDENNEWSETEMSKCI
jgi:hypothetical protein